MGNTNSKSAPFSLSSFVFCVVIASGMARKFFRGSKRRMSGDGKAWSLGTERGGVCGRSLQKPTTLRKIIVENYA